MNYKIFKQGVQRIADGANIPPSNDNMDWREYQKWLFTGNTPLPADIDPVVVPQPTLQDVIAVLPAPIKAALAARIAARRP